MRPTRKRIARGRSENGQRTRRPAAKEPAASESADAELWALLQQAALHVKALFQKAGEYASLGLKRLKLRAVDGVFTTILVVAALLAGATTIVCAAQLAVTGLRHAVARLTGAEWAGELGGGLFALASPFVVLVAVRWSARRTLLARALHSATNATTNGVADAAASRETAPASSREPTPLTNDVARRDAP